MTQLDANAASTASVLTRPGSPRDARDVAEAVAAAAASSEPLRLRSRGTWMSGGRPIEASRELDLSTLSGIVEYVPGDLTLTAHAATPLSELEQATLAYNQWLPLDPFGSAAGSLGATIATASGGALASTIGMPRDLALGLEVVTGRGEIISAGGRVVKNVAGYDLVRLQTGAWGTLGALTKVTVRLRGRPERDATFALTLPEDPQALSELVGGLRQLGGGVLAIELLSAQLAATTIGSGEPAVLVRIAGNSSLVDTQRSVLLKLGEVHDVDGAVAWSNLRVAEPGEAAVVRLSGPATNLGELWKRVGELGHPLAHASVLRGVARIFVDCTTEGGFAEGGEGLNTKLSYAALSGLSQLGRMIIERAPAGIWSQYQPPLSPAAALEGRMRLAFDPAGILNPGILGT